MEWDLRKASKDAVMQAAKRLNASKVPGTFIVRANVNNGLPSALGLTAITKQRKLANYLIEKKSGKFVMRGSQASFPSLYELVDYYSRRAHPPLDVQLVLTNDSEDEEFGFSEDETELEHRVDTPLTRRPPGGQDINELDALNISMLKKKAELIAAKRRAAELNVQILMKQQASSSNNSAHGDNESSLLSPEQSTRAQSDTRAQAQAEKSMEQSSEALENWKAQLIALDRMRQTAPPGGGKQGVLDTINDRRRERFAQSEAYTERARQAKQNEVILNEEEAQLLAEENELTEELNRLTKESLVLQAVEVDVKQMLLGAVGTAVMHVEVMRLEQERKAEVDRLAAEKAAAVEKVEQEKEETVRQLAQERAMLEQQLALTEADREQKERRLNEISNVMRPLAGILGGGAVGSYQPAQPTSPYGYAAPMYSTSYNQEPIYATPEPKDPPPVTTTQSNNVSRGPWQPKGSASPREQTEWWAHGPARPVQQQQQQQHHQPPPARSYDSPLTASPPRLRQQFNTQAESSPSTVTTGSTYSGSKNHFAKRIAAAAGKHQQQQQVIVDDTYETQSPEVSPPIVRKWKQPAPAPKSFNMQPVDDKPAFTAVKFKKPPPLQVQSTIQSAKDDQCTFLGNCTCPKCSSG